MGVLNRRNAVFGWAVWQTGKGAMKFKARRAMSGGNGRAKKGAAAGLAALGGAALFWRRRRGTDEPG